MDKLVTKISGKQLRHIKAAQFNDVVDYLHGLNEKFAGLGFSQLEEMAVEKEWKPCVKSMIKKALTERSKTKNK